MFKVVPHPKSNDHYAIQVVRKNKEPMAFLCGEVGLICYLPLKAAQHPKRFISRHQAQTYISTHLED